MDLTISINMDNAAFSDDPAEALRILKTVGGQIANGQDRGRCIDANGNVCGQWEIK